MFFYTSIFIASFIVAMVILWIYKSLANVGKQLYRALLPSAKDDPSSKLEPKILPTTINETRTPWGWDSLSKSSNHRLKGLDALAVTPMLNNIPTPWGWPGNYRKIRKHQPADPILNGSGLIPILNIDEPIPELNEGSTSNVGWPYRKEQFEFLGTQYILSREVKLDKTNLEAMVKPWGW